MSGDAVGGEPIKSIPELVTRLNEMRDTLVKLSLNLQDIQFERNRALHEEVAKISKDLMEKIQTK